MKLSYKETKVITVEKEVPDYFSHDDSKLGTIVDILVGKSLREDLFHNDKYVVELAISRLKEAYAAAEKILVSLEKARDWNTQNDKAFNSTAK